MADDLMPTFPGLPGYAPTLPLNPRSGDAVGTAAPCSGSARLQLSWEPQDPTSRVSPAPTDRKSADQQAYVEASARQPTPEPVSVPEPSTWMLLVTGLLALWLFHIRRKQGPKMQLGT